MLRMLSRALKIIKMRHGLKAIISNYLLFLENRNQTFWGSISEADEKGIIELTEKACSLPGPIVEIGALFGLTTQLIATYKPIGKKLIAVENYSWNPFYISPHDHRVMTQRVLRYAVKHCNTTIFDGSKQKFYNTYKGEKPSMVFIDADHTYESVMQDMEWATGLGIPIIAGHDYCELHPEVMHAVDEVFQHDIKVVGSVWYHYAP